MRLADNEITIRYEGEVIRLRPSLRAACRLCARHGGFDVIAREIAAGKLTMMIDVIVESTDREWNLTDFLRILEDMPLLGGIEALTEPLLRHVFALAGIDEDSTPTPKASPKKPMGFADYHTKLFQIATGYLGWSPETAWQATPAEIIEAYKGRMQLLKDIFGSSDDPETEHIPDTERDHAGWSALKLMVASGNNVGV